jgi:hypothetical protein
MPCPAPPPRRRARSRRPGCRAGVEVGPQQLAFAPPHRVERLEGRPPARLGAALQLDGSSSGDATGASRTGQRLREAQQIAGLQRAADHAELAGPLDRRGDAPGERLVELDGSAS